MGPEGYPVVVEENCVGCGACETVCPKYVMKVKTMSERLMHFNCSDDRLAPCRQTCPAEIDIPLYIAQIREGDYEGGRLRRRRQYHPGAESVSAVLRSRVPASLRDQLPQGNRG
jgi:MinD superfamily P-loop ATPase